MTALTHKTNLAFFDAISPIIDAESIDTDKVFRASRYDKGGADYLNCPMDEERVFGLLRGADGRGQGATEGF